MFNSERIKYGQGIASMFDTSKNIYTATIRPYYKIKHNLYDKKLEALVYSSSIVRGFKKKGLRYSRNPCGSYWIRTSDFYPVKVTL